MKTRAKKGSASQTTSDEQPRSKIHQLDDSVPNPPRILVLPENPSQEARIVSIPNPATSTLSRYLICPEKGFYEFTRIAAPKRAYRSWLLAPDQASNSNGTSSVDTAAASNAGGEGYVLQSPEMMIATPIDPLFLVLPAITPGEEEAGRMQMFLSLSDYVDKLEERAPHFKQVMRSDRDHANGLDKILEARIAAVCDELEAGNEKLYKLSNKKLLNVLVNKARNMAAKGLPASMEERFVKQPLVVPMMSVKRETSSMSFASDGVLENAATGASQDDSSSTSTSQDTELRSTTMTSVPSAATSTAPASNEDGPSASEETTLLRLRTALDFLLSSYVAPPLRKSLNALLTSSTCSLDFKPLDQHLAHVDKLKQDAQALRSLSENISRKRGIEDDEDAQEKADAKKRKKEQEEFRKKNTSRGVQQLKKTDTSGMKKLSSFFAKSVAKKG